MLLSPTRVVMIKGGFYDWLIVKSHGHCYYSHNKALADKMSRLKFNCLSKQDYEINI